MLGWGPKEMLWPSVGRHYVSDDRRLVVRVSLYTVLPRQQTDLDPDEANAVDDLVRECGVSHAVALEAFVAARACWKHYDYRTEKVRRATLPGPVNEDGNGAP